MYWSFNTLKMRHLHIHEGKNLTLRLHQCWRRWGTGWTASCCCRWLGLPQQLLQWMRSCRQPGPSQRQTWPQLFRIPWQYQSQPSSVQVRHSLRHQSRSDQLFSYGSTTHSNGLIFILKIITNSFSLFSYKIFNLRIICHYIQNQKKFNDVSFWYQVMNS